MSEIDDKVNYHLDKIIKLCHAKAILEEEMLPYPNIERSIKWHIKQIRIAENKEAK